MLFSVYVVFLFSCTYERSRCQGHTALMPGTKPPRLKRQIAKRKAELERADALRLS